MRAHGTYMCNNVDLLDAALDMGAKYLAIGV